MCWCAISALYIETPNGPDDDVCECLAYDVMLEANGFESLAEENDSGRLKKEHWDKAIVFLGGAP